ncbi:four helix bundle protein [Prosthecobacter sp. SYSU 5D2]|uniref:four helix bundle protein n=1 Tax=Prosthecobacter sp. SYSU 5D2 TaxID=3134134 RepID=UPI0031FEF795
MFRFQELTVWQRALEIGIELDDLSDQLESRKRFRQAEQLRSAAMSISNNIAEGSGSSSKKDFAHFVNIAKRSAFETANMLIFFERKKLLSPSIGQPLLIQLESLCRMMESFRKSLLP